MSTQQPAPKTATAIAASSGGRRWKLQLVGAWRLSGPDGALRVTLRQQRLISLLALQGGRPRSVLAGVLWPESAEERASGSLRESLWTINHQAPGLLEDDGRIVALADGVDVDADRIRKHVAVARTARPGPQRLRLLGLLRDAALLPGWYEDWVLTEQDGWLRMRLSALEGLAAEFLEAGQTALAADAAQCAVEIDPWRESALGLLLRSHLDSGDHVRVIQLYEAFAVRLRSEFGVAPSPRLSALVAPVAGSRPGWVPVPTGRPADHRPADASIAARR
ncbi:MAG: BTAD domain-containing putative transcriptional regulator [Arthrobacter sp.]|uniref:AfsR/SARP family transcriptional regulator n=1 Tax=Arthrobacter sp. TaxID=1667 RepID=UPI00347589D2